MARQRPHIKSETFEFLDQEQTMGLFGGVLRDDSELQQLLEEANNRGFAQAEGAEGFVGYRQTTTATEPINPPRKGGPPNAEPVGEISVEITGQALTGGKGRGEAAIAFTRITTDSGENVVYPLLLVAPDGDFQRATELIVHEGEIVEAESWWTAFVGCLGNGCAQQCLSALFSCGGAWNVYLWCLLWKCGPCVTRCLACATCNCKWWCKWATGCCKQ
jgi:hypothetical protein